MASKIHSNQRAQVNPFAAAEICELVERTAGGGEYSGDMQKKNI